MVDDAAAIVDRHVAHDVDYAGVGIDLDLGDVRAAGKGHRRRHAVERVELAGIAPRHFLERDAEVGALHAEAALAEFDIRGRHLEVLRRQLQRLLHHRTCGSDERAAVRHHRARADGAAADQLGTCRVAGAKFDAVGVDAELQRHQLGKHRLVALA